MKAGNDAVEEYNGVVNKAKEPSRRPRIDALAPLALTRAAPQRFVAWRPFPSSLGNTRPDASARRSPRLLEGFDRHYALFRECARAAKRHFEAGNWLAIGHVARDRIDFYDRRVAETVDRIERDFARRRARRRAAPTRCGRRSSAATSPC